MVERDPINSLTIAEEEINIPANINDKLSIAKGCNLSKNAPIKIDPSTPPIPNIDKIKPKDDELSPMCLASNEIMLSDRNNENKIANKAITDKYKTLLLR